jgi:serine/threonine protein phosphatase PrpC
VEKLYDSHLAETLRATRFGDAKANPAQRLVNESLEMNCRDNTTALVVQIF